MAAWPPPMKMDGIYHMAGKVCVCGKEIVDSVIAKSKGILNSLPGKKIIVTPLPRYLYTSCCDREGHCDGTGTIEHVNRIVEDTIQLRKTIVNGLVKQGVKNFTVLDLLSSTFGTTVDEITSELKKVSSSDGVHLTSAGYGSVADTIKKNLAKDTPPVSVSGPTNAATGGFFWRGFLSPVGTPRQKPHSLSYKQARMVGGKWKHSYADSNRGYPSGRGRGHGSGPKQKF